MLERIDLHAAFKIAKEEGFSLVAAAQNQAKNEAGVSYLKRMTLQDAVGSMGRDKRCKTKDIDLKPSGYLGDMIMKGVGRNSIICVKSCLKQFMEYADRKSFFAAPRHPYSQALLDAVPTIDIGAQPAGGKLVDGEIPDLTLPQTGCRFASRCPHARDVCNGGVPQLQDWPGSTGHRLACHLTGTFATS